MNAKFYTYQGKTYNQKQLAALCGVHEATFAARLARGMNIEAAMQPERANALREHICPICGKVFLPKTSKRIYCSRACAGKANKPRTAKYNHCKVCGKEMPIQNRKGAYCSQECRKQGLKKNQPKPKKQIRLYKKECRTCGKEFETHYSFAAFCSDTCRHRHDSRNYKKRLRKCAEKDKTITLEKLFERDGGVCAICGKVLQLGGNKLSADAPTIDHVKPLAKGGVHIWENVQLACRHCNSSKGDLYE